MPLDAVKIKRKGITKKTCTLRVIIGAGDSSSTSKIDLQVQRRTDEEELEAAYNGMALEMELNDGGPPVSQPIQAHVLNYIIEAAHVPPLEVAAAKIRKLNAQRN